MFLRPHYRRKNGKRHAYWALVESYRTERGSRQRVVAYLGQLDEAQRLGVHEAADATAGSAAETSLRRRATAVGRSGCEARAGGEPSRFRRSLARSGIDRGLGVEGRFSPQTMPRGDEEIPWSLMALVLVLSRLCDPSSELYIAEHSYAHSALADLLGIPAEKINEQRLYRALDALLPHKEALEMFLKNRLGELFGLEYDLLLYDVTSTYFEGQAEGNPLARRGYSRDHRPDCKQVCIGLVVSRCGMPLGYEVFAGNRADVTTLQEIVETMERRYGQAERIWVVDRGMVSAREHRVSQAERPALHRGHAEEHAQAIRAGASGRGLAYDPRRLGSEALSRPRGRGNLRALPQPRSPREGKGDARAI